MPKGNAEKSEKDQLDKFNDSNFNEHSWNSYLTLHYTEHLLNGFCNSPPSPPPPLPVNGSGTDNAEVDANANFNSSKTIVDSYDTELQKPEYDENQRSMLNLHKAPIPKLGYYADIMMIREGIKGKHSKIDDVRLDTLQLPESTPLTLQRRYSSASNSSVGEKDILLELITGCREIDELNLNFEKKLFIRKDYFLSTAFGLLLGILTALFARSLILVLFGK